MADSNLAVIILAAGQGTRMKSATPKVLHALAGRPLIGHVLAAADALEPERVVLVVRHQRQRVEEAARTLLRRVEIAEQGDIPGTGAAAEAGLDVLDEGFVGDVLITSGDVPLLGEDALAEFITAHRASGAAASVLTARIADPTGYGRVVRTASGDLEAIVEQRDATEQQLLIDEVNSGTYLFQANDLRRSLAQVGVDNAQNEKYLTDAVGVLVREGRPVAAHVIDDPMLVQGINDREQLAEVATELNRRIIRRWRLAGVTIQDAASTWVDVTVELGQDVTLLPGTQLRGTTVVQDEAVIGPDTTLVDTEVGFGAEVCRTHSLSARIGENSHVGPFSYLRPGTVLGNEGKIGTFVETKNVTIGHGAKLPHLSYAGDAEIGEGSNIGAGTIFANYDGVHKHRSTVGPQVRTGAHNVFVAPVHIGAGVYSGGGTIIRKDVPAGSLVITQAPQVNKEGWVIEHRAGTAAAEAAEAALNGDQNAEQSNSRTSGNE
ncbi:bifunctional UDP-N-acetylglucosamine diphosphorylase/glucosamine-1-phosphate N-acetyltransferase GlmU [Pseudoclavibacter sp. CFCC 14310]|uniref:bifunctional UDP-N-acetylglucosamine diphosphorylase/glucosamine-1-phosphate N-acetyltransferase GlmU n=1 Tax=Pseudoclavibacter sp. CFCC 14310 TaxID=2615180 RepID=UPI0013011891|nr:bifunctional UDP-N-acetylglucosamine diphosphorylase/glucosamine-1-phosphate N-acetyltransferase GlmU [Pseudoclavibacter sp. CFCC 14310]KAB1647358.1 bifunctional UDP-N-acetylglucosamine diphosphorylase/glucosamine-1-phosphate N-acetyltransferase GlmU [Pseudoclavibacter sp. CFCC 14310]